MDTDLLVYMTYEASLTGNAYGTIKGRLMAIRHHHLVAGLAGPLQGKERLWLTLRGLKRASAEVIRKLPVTIGMLRWIRGELWHGDLVK